MCVSEKKRIEEGNEKERDREEKERISNRLT